MEINAAAERRFVRVVVRSTAEPIVVNLPDDDWQRDAETPAVAASSASNAHR